jgi:hypothetical protein
MSFNCDHCHNEDLINGCDHCRELRKLYGSPPPPTISKLPERIKPESFNPDNCKQRVFPGARYNSVERQCRRKLWIKYPEDGYCPQHHPDTLEAERIRLARYDRRNMLRLEWTEVGRWMWGFDRIAFDTIVATLHKENR